MTSPASVILSGAKNLNSRRVLARRSKTDPLPLFPLSVQNVSTIGYTVAPQNGRPLLIRESGGFADEKEILRDKITGWGPGAGPLFHVSAAKRN